MLIALLLLLLAGPAQADIRVVDTATDATSVPVRAHDLALTAWSEDGAALLVRRRALYAVPLSGGARVRASDQLGAAVSIGPGGRTVEDDGRGNLILGPGERIIARRLGDVYGATVAWSRDGSRVAIGGDERLDVYDTTTGTVLLTRPGDLRLSSQAFAPDGTALVGIGQSAVLRIDVATGAATEVDAGEHYVTDVTWGSRIAISTLGGIVLSGLPEVEVPIYGPALWNADGTALAFQAPVNGDCQQYGDMGATLLVPGHAPRTVVAPSAQHVNAVAWAPTGSRLAIGRDAPPKPAKRGKRHPWPKTIGRDYSVFTRAGNAAVRKAVVAFTRSLKRGASREEAFLVLHRGLARVDDDGIGDTEAEEAIATEIDPWLIAAGYKGVDGLSEISC